uniref:dentin sialophosphoprotein-like n=1 Tax=Erigeron canadensis TaxID=72917 RepID=UPI001CB8A4B8|nr:dentin sialophosphoprotein-like [Erigeron canadensis]
MYGMSNLLGYMVTVLGSSNTKVSYSKETGSTECLTGSTDSDSDDSESSENASANDSDDDSSDDSDSSDDGNDEGVADSSDGSAAATETDTDESASVADSPRNERRTKLVHDVSAASESDHSHQSFVQEGAALHRERRSKACHAVPAISDSAHSVHDAHSHIPDRAAQIDPDVAAQNDSELRGIFDDMDDPVNRASSVSPVKRTGGADLKYTRTKRRRVAEATSVAIPDPPRPTAAVIPAVSQAQVLRPLVAPSLSYRLPSDSSLVRRVDLLETQVQQNMERALRVHYSG